MCKKQLIVSYFLSEQITFYLLLPGWILGSIPGNINPKMDKLSRELATKCLRNAYEYL